MKFKKKKIVKKNTVIHCKKKKEMKALLKWAHSRGFKWRSGVSFLSFTHWSDYKGKTCYEIKDGSYSSIEFFKKNGYKILKFKDVVKKEK